MPIIDLQRRLAEVGRIRLGTQVKTSSGKKHPTALNTFRLTSTDRQKIADAAKLYGGTVAIWDAPSGRQEFEVITETDCLPVVVPPSSMCFSQAYELWSGGGCQRRCDGQFEQISDGPCLCEPEHRRCEPHTRLSVMLRDLSGLGTWRVDTTGWYAAIELQSAVEVIALAAGRGTMLPARLRLEQRTAKHAEEGVRHFVVPVLDIDITPEQLLMGTVSVQPQLPSQRALTPVPEGGQPPSIAKQMKAADDIPSRRRASTPSIPATGIAPRTAAQADHAQADGGQPWPKAFDPQPEHGEETQDLPRMASDGQLTKLNTLLKEQGFDDSPDGRAGKLDWCMSAIRRRITSSKELTFDEAHTLINTLVETGLEEALNEPGLDAPGEIPPGTEVEVVAEEPESDALFGELPLEDVSEKPKKQARPTNAQLDDIRKGYEAKDVTGAAILGDITEFLQLEQPLTSLHKLTKEEAAAVLVQLQNVPAE